MGSAVFSASRKSSGPAPQRASEGWHPVAPSDALAPSHDWLKPRTPAQELADRTKRDHDNLVRAYVEAWRWPCPHCLVALIDVKKDVGGFIKIAADVAPSRLSLLPVEGNAPHRRLQVRPGPYPKRHACAEGQDWRARINRYVKRTGFRRGVAA